jgi:thiamine kinase-like enzyme
MKLTESVAKRSTKEIYREDDTVVKRFSANYYSAANVLNEALNQTLIHETGYLLPELLDVRRLEGDWSIVMSYIPGVTLAQSFLENDEAQESLMDRLVGAQLEMHALNVPRLRHHVDKMHEYIERSGLDEVARYELHTRLSSLPRHNKLCHGDFVPENLIITAKKDVYVLDWAHATQGNSAADAACSYMKLWLNDQGALAERYLTRFCTLSGIPEEQVRRWLPIVAAAQLAYKNQDESVRLMQWAHAK